LAEDFSQDKKKARDRQDGDCGAWIADCGLKIPRDRVASSNVILTPVLSEVCRRADEAKDASGQDLSRTFRCPRLDAD
jgi:hypothetical protein